MRIPRVKICGITRVEDALQAVACGADALGFVFYDKSPRCVTPEQVREIAASLPPLVTTVGLFVNAEQGVVRDVVDLCRLDAVQYHGDETPETCHCSPARAIKALRVKDATSLQGHEAFKVSALLLDAWSDDAYGGTGKSFSWQLAAEVASQRSVILAGGLTADNVADAVAAVQPYAVDVSSGVELSPGEKDPEKVAAFIRAAKGLNK